MATEVGILLKVDGKTGVLKVAEQDVGKLGKGLASAGKRAKESSVGFNALSSSIGNLIAVGAVVSFFREAVQAATALQETQAKFETVFRQNVAQAEEFASNLVDNFNVSEEAAKNYLATIQDTLVPMGLARQAAADLSNEIVQLAADLGSFNDVPTEIVVRDLQSALVGNTETVKKYGVVLKASDIQQRALTDSGKTVAAELTNAEKVTAAYKLILGGTADAQGDVARTSGSFANQVRKLSAGVKDLQADIGEGLIPVLTNMISTTTAGGDTLRQIALIITGVVAISLTGVKSVFDIVTTVVKTLVEVLLAQAIIMQEIVRGTVNIAIGFIKGGVSGATEAAKELVGRITELAADIVETIGEGAEKIVSDARKNSDTLVEVSKNTFQKIVSDEAEAAEQRKETDNDLTKSKEDNARKISSIEKGLILSVIEIEEGKFAVARLRLEAELEAARAKGIEQITIEGETGQRIITLEEIKQLRLKEIRNQEDKENKERRKREEKADQATLKRKTTLALSTAKTVTDSLSTVLQASAGSSAKQEEIAKAASIANALRSTFEGATKALATVPFPFNFGVAALVTAAGLANVAKIQSFQGGGRRTKPTLGIFGDGGEGETQVPDSKAALFAAGVAARRAAGGLDLGGGGAPQVDITFGDIIINVTAANFNDPTAIDDIMQNIAQRLQDETEAGFKLARRISDTNDNNSDLTV